MSLRSLPSLLAVSAVIIAASAVPLEAGWPSQTGEVWLPPRRGLFGNPFVENNAFHPSAKVLYKWNVGHHHHHVHGHAYGYGSAYGPAPVGYHGHAAGCLCGHCQAASGYGFGAGGRLDYAPYRYNPDPAVYGVYVP